MGRGPFEVELTTIELGDISLHVGHASPLMGFAKVAADRAVVQLPARNVGNLLLNGVACQPGVVGIYGCDAELLRANPQPSSFASLILPFGSVERLLEPPRRSKLLCRAAMPCFRSSQPPGRATNAYVHAAQDAATAIPDSSTPSSHGSPCVRPCYMRRMT